MESSTEEYQRRFNVSFVDALGAGKDGSVFKTNRQTAVKLLNQQILYNRELHAYRVLLEIGLSQIAGFQIPRLVSSDDELLAIEMSIVKPPFLLDFAAAYTEEEIEWLAFDEDVMAERQSHWAEVFADRWPVVINLRDEFQRLTGLVLLDLSLNNIRFDP